MADDYLNKKSWHPGSHRNRERVWKAQQEAEEKERRNRERDEQLREERVWEREQALTADEKAKRAGGVAWMYQSNMPMTSAAAKAETASRGDTAKRRTGAKSRDDPARSEARLAKMLDGIRSSTGVAATGAGRGDGHGYGFVGGELDEEEEEAAFRLAALPEDERGEALKRIKKRRRKEEKRAKQEKRAREVQAARALLREAGVQVDLDDDDHRHDDSS